MVIVDTKDVDQEVGKDLDPEHEKAEVEDRAEWRTGGEILAIK